MITAEQRDEAMVSLSHNSMQLGQIVDVVHKLFRLSEGTTDNALLYCEWADAYRAGLKELQQAYQLGRTEEQTKWIITATKLNQSTL